MEPKNTFIFRQSELPSLSDELKAEIAEIDFNVANLILKIQGHYQALSELTEVLSNCLDSCEMNLHSIRIALDGEKSVPAIGLTDLPKEEKNLILSTAITSTVAIKIIPGIFGCDFETAASHVGKIGQLEFSSMSPEAIEGAIEEMAKMLKDNPDGGMFHIEVED